MVFELIYKIVLIVVLFGEIAVLYFFSLVIWEDWSTRAFKKLFGNKHNRKNN